MAPDQHPVELRPEVEYGSTASAGFEGPEKRLEVYFRPTKSNSKVERSGGFRDIKKDEWSDILVDAQCSILSYKSNKYFDAYLLSESSLFVYATKLMIKTCGTTTLLRIVPRLQILSDGLGLEMDYLQYSRASFTFPNQQLHPHTSFQSEVDYLNKFFSGQSYVLGTPDGATQWHLYIAGECRIRTADQALEVFMFDLDPRVMKHFFNVDDIGKAEVGSSYGAQTSIKSGIQKLIGPGATVDAYNFEPCGYSMNGLEDGSYYTIHITPEPDCSYVSFECILPLVDFSSLLQRVLSTFKPRKFSVTFHADIIAPAGACGLKDSPELESPLQYRAVGDSTFLRMKTTSGHEVSATLRSYLMESDFKESISSCTKVQRELKGCCESISEVATTFRAVEYKKAESCEDIARQMVQEKGLDQPSYLVDLSMVRHRIDMMLHAFHSRKREIRFSVKFNSDPAIIRLLDQVGCVFDACSTAELSLLSAHGVKSEHIVLTNPIIGLSGLKWFGEDYLGTLTIFDDMDKSTILKLGDAYPNAAVELRLMNPLAQRVEAAVENARITLKTAVSAGLRPIGMSLSLSATEGTSTKNFRRALEVSHALFSSFLRPGCEIGDCIASTFKRLSVGATFPGAFAETGEIFLAGLQQTKELIDEYFPPNSGIVVAVDPGRFVISESHALVVSVVARRDLREGGSIAYYVNDGIYGAFYRKLKSTMDCSVATPISLSKEGMYEPCEVMGPSCDDVDRLWTGKLPLLQVGDSLLFKNMGSYAAPDPVKHNVYYYVRT